MHFEFLSTEATVPYTANMSLISRATPLALAVLAPGRCALIIANAPLTLAATFWGSHAKISGGTHKNTGVGRVGDEEKC